MKYDEIKVDNLVMVNVKGSVYNARVGVVKDKHPDESWNAGSTIGVQLMGFSGLRYFPPFTLVSAEDIRTMPEPEREPEPQFTMAMLTEHFEGFLDQLEMNDPEGWQDDEQFIMARKAVNSAKLSLKKQHV